MKKILYVEDHADTAQVVKLILGVVGYKVEIAKDGKEGLKKIKKNKYDLIICDIMLPDISGLELFEKMKKQKKNKTTKYVFLSVTHIPEEKKKKLEKQGAEAFIPKPFEKNQLIKKVQNAIEKKTKK